MKFYQHIANGLSVLLMVWALAGCSSEVNRVGVGVNFPMGGDPNDPNNPNNPNDPDPNDPLDPNDPVADRNGTIGIRNFRQLSGSLSFVTGVPTTTAQVITQLSTTQSSLSVDGDATKVNSANLLKAMELAAVYCLNAANTVALRTRVYGNFDFAAAPANIADGTLATLAQSILNAFIPDSSVDAAVGEKVQVIVDMIKGIRGSAVAGAAANTTRTNMVVGGCTAVAASQGFIFLN